MIPPRNHQLEAVSALGVLLRMRRPSVPVQIWRWRWEVIMLVAAVGGFYLSASTLGPLQTGLLILAAGALAFALRPVREWLVGRAWCVLTPHRFRHGCMQSGLLSFSGRVPSVLWTRPTRFGERMYVWCPAGITVDALITASALLSAACWARDVQTSRTSARWSQLATVDVIRTLEPTPPLDRSDPVGPVLSSDGPSPAVHNRADRHADWHRVEAEPGLHS